MLRWTTMQEVPVYDEMEEFAQLCRDARLARERERDAWVFADKTIHDLVKRLQFAYRPDTGSAPVDLSYRYLVPAAAPGGDTHDQLEQFMLAYRAEFNEGEMLQLGFPAGEPQAVWLFRNGQEVRRPLPVVCDVQECMACLEPQPQDPCGAGQI